MQPDVGSHTMNSAGISLTLIMWTKILIVLQVATLFLLTNVIDSTGSHGIHMKKGAPHIKLPYGLIYGTVAPSRNGRYYYAFSGLRYANPPKRFENSALLNQTWKSVKPAVVPGARCAQNQWGIDKVVGEEDCLFLNIHVPIEALKGKLLPVMVWIHGGGFIDGSGDRYNPKYFMDDDVIIVTINYRLGAFGFLSTQDEIVPGNFGLNDQIVSLQYIQKNIEAFGGDSKKVTIFGESAGGASVHYLVLSPKGKGLFQNAMAISGNALNLWARTRAPLDVATQLAKLLNCSTATSLELVQCLKLKSTEEILGKSKKLKIWNDDPLIHFGPTVETHNGKEAFLSDTPENLVKLGKFNNVPLVIGVNEHEGLVLQALPILMSEKLTKDLNEDWIKLAPLTFGYQNVFNNDEMDEISAKIREFYFGDKSVGPETRENLTDLYSDVYFVYGARNTALAHSKQNNVYLYLLTYKSDFTLTSLFGIKENYGVTHADDLHLYFEPEVYGPPVTKNSTSYEFSEKIVRLFVSFATHGQPTKTWGPASIWEPLNAKHIKQGKPLKWYRLDEETSILKDPFKARMKFWDNLYKQYEPKMQRDEL